MKKRIISLALSAVTAISAVSAMNTNAVLNYWEQLSEQVIEETFKDAVKLEDYEWIVGWAGSHQSADFVYMTATEDSYAVIYKLNRTNDSIIFDIDSDTDISELEKQIKAFDESFEIKTRKLTDNKTHIYIYSKEISLENARKIRETVGSDVSDFIYEFNNYIYSSVNVDYMTGYSRHKTTINENDESIKEPTEEILREYVEDHSEAVEFAAYSSGEKDFRGANINEYRNYVIPKKELTAMEHLELARDIYDETGLFPVGYGLEGVNEPISLTLDLTDYLNGDANCDGIQSMADAASIFQAIGNPDKYALSDLGQFNADYAGDGLTPDDAIAIQKKIAGITE